MSTPVHVYTCACLHMCVATAVLYMPCSRMPYNMYAHILYSIIIPNSSLVTGVNSCLRCLVNCMASSVPLSHCMREREREREREGGGGGGHKKIACSGKGFVHKTETEMHKHPQGLLSTTTKP